MLADCQLEIRIVEETEPERCGSGPEESEETGLIDAAQPNMVQDLAGLPEKAEMQRFLEWNVFRCCNQKLVSE